MCFRRRRKTCFLTDDLTYNTQLKHNQRSREMKSYDELKAKMGSIQQQMVEAKKNERDYALRNATRLYKEFCFNTGC